MTKMKIGNARRTRATLMASALILGSSMVGCSGASLDRRPAIAAAQGPVTATRIEKALASKDFARALLDAERLVAAAPQEASYRALLGRAYLANGRYLSARSAFSDAMTLGNRDVRTIVSLALAEAGTGHGASARALLEQNISNLPAGDYGLAMAIAGDPQEGVRALLEAVAMEGATATTRQNLAYAFALAGDWAQAEMTVTQDMDAATARERLAQWSQAARQGAEPLRVAALIGVMPRLDDAGMPVQLALNAVPGAAVQQASVDGLIGQARADVSAEAPPPVEMAAAQDAPQPADLPGGDGLVTERVPAATLAAAFDTPPAPVVRAPDDAMRSALKTAFARRSGTSDDAFSRKLPTPVAPEKASDWVVQLGAYDSHAVAAEKWGHIRKARPGLKGYAVVNSTLDLRGRLFHRLAIRGFGDRSDAAALCASMRSSGQACFVRTDDRASAGMMARAGAGKSIPVSRQTAQSAPAKRPSTRQVASR